MSVYFKAWMQSVNNLHWAETTRNHSATTLPTTIADVFEEKIKEIICLQNHHDAVAVIIQECIQAVKQDLGPFNFVPSVHHWDKLAIHFHTFSQLMNKHASPTLTPDETKAIAAYFQSTCIKLIVEQWTASAAQHFYLIGCLSTLTEKIEAAQLWRQQFVTVNKRMNQLNAEFTENASEFNLASQVETAFRTYWHTANTQKMKTLTQWMENDTATFTAIAPKVAAKAGRAPESLTRHEQDYLECTDNARSCLTHHWPLFNAQAKCLQQCLGVNDLIINAFTQLETTTLEWYRQIRQ